MGRPSRRWRRSSTRLTRQSSRCTCSTGTRRRTNSRQSATETPCERTVDHAAPADAHARARPTATTTRTTFRTQLRVRKTSGVRESPIARMIADRKLKNIIVLAPRKLMTAKVVASGSSSSGVCSRRSAGPGQQRRGDREHDARRRRQHRPGRDRPAHGRVVAGAERLRGRDREAVRHAPREAEQEEQQRARGADGGERVDAEDAADDDGVGRLVELLDDVADEQGDGEQEDDAPGATGGEDLGHSETLGLESGWWDVRGGRWCRVASCVDRIDTIPVLGTPFPRDHPHSCRGHTMPPGRSGAIGHHGPLNLSVGSSVGGA